MVKREQNSDKGHASTKKSGIHADWRAWTVVGLMLAAMLAYVLSDNESIQPDEEGGRQMPAAEADAE